MKKYYISIITFLVLASCTPVDPNKQIDEGQVKENIYNSGDIGWTIKIPEGWTVITKDQAKSADQKGKEAIEKTTGTALDMSKLKHLISFQKNNFNIFASTSEPFKEEYEGEYNESCRNLNRLIFDTYQNQGIKADTISGRAMIDNLEFKTFEAKIYDSGGKLILSQIIYSRLINGFDFGVNINYNNSEDRDIMIKALNESTFKKK